MKVTLEEFEAIKVMGEIVILKQKHHPMVPKYVPAMVLEYDRQRGLAKLWTGTGYAYSEVPYDADLVREPSWCYKRDISVLKDPQPVAAGQLPEPVDIIPNMPTTESGEAQKVMS